MRSLLFAAALVPASALAAPAPSPRAELKAAVEKLQASPDDAELRKKIIALAAKSKPAVPEEARRHYVKAVTMQKTAKTSAGSDAAIAEYRKALQLAPWWADAYYNLSLAAEAAGKPSAAIDALKLYLLTGPGKEDARQAQDRIYALEAKADLAAAEAPKTPAVPGLEGVWKENGRADDANTAFRFEKSGDGFSITQLTASPGSQPLSGSVTGVSASAATIELGPYWVSQALPSVNATLSCKRDGPDELHCDKTMPGGAGGYAVFQRCVDAAYAGNNEYGRQLWHCRQ